MQKTYDPIFKRDSKGQIRVWWMEQDGDKFRTHAGLDGGAIVTSEWTRCEPTNVGRSNERDGVAQATFEIEAAYEKKLTREYHRTIEGTAAGAHFFKPMLAQKYETFEPGYAQPKLDGIRCIATAAGLFSREGKPIESCPHIVAALSRTFELFPDAVLDGELYNHALKDDFNTIVSLVKKKAPTPDQLAEIAAKVQYHVYDVPSVAGPFKERFRFAYGIDPVAYAVDNAFISDPAGALRNLGSCVVRIVETRQVDDQETFDQLHGSWLERGYEGSMWRCLNTPYEQKRSKSLRKRKDFMDEEFRVVRIEEGLGNWAGMAKRVVCQLPDGREFGAGIKGSMERARELLHEDHKVVTVQFFAYTPDGIPRFPVATKFHGAERTL